jgi:hypothetical protein
MDTFDKIKEDVTAQRITSAEDVIKALEPYIRALERVRDFNLIKCDAGMYDGCGRAQEAGYDGECDDYCDCRKFRHQCTEDCYTTGRELVTELGLLPEKETK